MRTALVILAAGIGSRFKGGIKQLTPVGPNDELIIDYSVFDAVAAGFNEVVFIIRRDMENTFRETICNRLERKIDGASGLERISFAFQELEDLPEIYASAAKAAGRTKPWGTGHAILACRKILDCPFAVINADDYYGKEAFSRIHDFLIAHGTEQRHYCMAGFVLRNTLSDFGTVTRGICSVGEDGYLAELRETRGLARTESGASANGISVDPDTLVSMNMWGFTPDVLRWMEDDFHSFLQHGSLAEDEFILPEVLGHRLKAGDVRICCLPTQDNWFGVTYQEDKQIVKEKILALTEQGVYPAPLWE